VYRGFNNFLDLNFDTQEVYLFEKKDGDWESDLFSSFDINAPYKLVSVVEKSSQLQLHLKNPKTGNIQEYALPAEFYGYFIGSKADISGLKMKSQSYLTSIESLEYDARKIIKKIDWLDLEDISLKNVLDKLPKYPFEEYFNYVKKENVRKMDISEVLVEKLKSLILKHMPENDTPIGMEYIPIDKLLYLFHAIIPRAEALVALEVCDIVYEPPALVLGFKGKHQLPPKYLVPISHVASAYQQFPSFIEACN